MKEIKNIFFAAAFLFAITFGAVYFVLPFLGADDYKTTVRSAAEASPPEEKIFIATHLKTPETVKGVYMTSWVAGTPTLRNNILRLLEETELNTVVIDIKDDTGRVSYEILNPELKVLGSEDIRIADLRDLIGKLHEKNIYVVGRIAAFQDPFMVKKFPESAVKKASDGSIWRDRKGLTWIDPGAKDHWQYLAALARESYLAGFDEIQFDYIRFPSDGNMWDIYYPYSEGRIKREVIRSFFAFLDEKLSDTGMKISADLFGMTTTNTDDLNIGQVLEDAFPYFDYISPMVYPSHYPSGFYGHSNVNAVPYEIVKISMDSAVNRLNIFHNTVASTTVKLRPWLQDNDYPVPYTPDMIRAQIKATYDSGLDSWMLWDAGNTYTRAALLSE